MPEFGLSRSEILRGRKELQHLFSSGKRFYEDPFKVVYKIRPIIPGQSINRVGVAVPKKAVRLAHDRNRIKRQCRECIRLQRHILLKRLEDQRLSLDFFIIYNASDHPDFNFISDKIILILQRLLIQV